MVIRSLQRALLAVLFSSGILLAAPAEKPVLEKEFQESARFIKNPDCGWIAYNYEDSYGLRRRAAGGREPFVFASVVYTRHPRKAWQTGAGDFAGSEPLKLLKNWIAHERYVAFRIYANKMGHLPEELRGKVQGIGPKGSGITYWDRDYVEDHRRLVQYLGSRLGDSPYLAFVDIGGVGNTGGEWYFAPREVYRKAGYEGETRFELFKQFVQMYREAFPRTRLVISYECVPNDGERAKAVMELLKENDIGVRDDGLGGWPYPRQHPPLDAWPMPLFWRDLPVLFEGGGRGGGVYGWKQQGKDPADVLDWVFGRCHPSYINIGGSETASEKGCDELGSLLIRYGRRLGYRFALLHARCPARLRAGGSFELRMRWANRGIAPCYVKRPIELSFFRPEGGFAAAVSAQPDPPTTEWGPEEVTEVTVPFSVPSNLETGHYRLKVRMLLGDPRDPARAVEIATEGADREGRYALGRVSVTGTEVAMTAEASCRLKNRPKISEMGPTKDALVLKK